jgi:LysM repeat protein
VATMDFQELLDRYKQLRVDFDAGKIDEEEFQDEIEGLQHRDEQGVYWTIGAQSGKWYRFDGNEWAQETPMVMTKHQGRGIPELVSRLTQPRQTGQSSLPRWLYTGCAGFLLLAVVALLVVVAANFLRTTGVRVGQAPTPTLISGIPPNTPTPAPTPSEAPTAESTPTQPTLKVYSNSAFGLSVQYPSDWQAKEGVGRVILAPSAEGLNTSLGEQAAIKAVAFVVSLEGAGIVDTSSNVLDRISAGLPVNPASSETGTRAVNGVEWAISQVKLNASNGVGDMTAYLAATVYNNTAYTILAAAPSAEWNETAPVLQRMFDSVRFSAPQAEATTGGGTEAPVTVVAAVTDTATPAPTDTPVPVGSPTPVIYVVESGDTLLAIAMQYDVSVDDIEAANGIDDPGKLRVGQELTIPIGGYVPAGAGAVTATITVTVSLSPTLPTGITPLSTSTATIAASGTPTATGEVPATPVETAESGSATVEPSPGTETPGETPGTVTPGETPGTVTPGETPGTVTPGETPGAIAAEATAVETSEPTAAAEPNPTPAASEVALTGKIVYPVFAPERVLQGQPGGYDVYSSDPQGNNRQLLVYNASQPTLNSGGDMLAYKSWESTGRGIAFLSIGGDRSGMLTSYVEDGLPSWDPSSITMIFTSRREGDRVPRLFRVNQANDQESGFGVIAEYASVFPNGRIVYKGCTVEGACGIFVVGSEGVGATQITNNSSDTAPAPSPDGTKIAFMSLNRDGAGNYEIFVMDADGNNAIRLTNNAANDGLPTWSPDGNAIAFASDRDGTWAIWAMNPDGSNQRKLFGMGGSPDGIVGSELNSSRGWLEERISWSR